MNQQHWMLLWATRIFSNGLGCDMTCALCQSNDFEVISEIDAKSREKLIVSQCTCCSLVQQTPMPSQEELSAYYEHEYRLDYKRTKTPKPKHVLRAGKLALERIEFLKAAPGNPQGSVLDIGAGGGEFLYLCSQKGFAQVQGIEPNKGYCEYAQQDLGVNIEQKRLQDLQGTYDIITMFHVFEHLRDPLEMFQRLHQLLSPQGWLLIEVPWLETQNQSPSNTFFKAHTLYFSAETLVACGSPYFTAEVVQTQESILRIIFRPRTTPGPLQLPAPEAVLLSRQRMQQKGWLEYLCSGNGLRKPWQKITQACQESQVKKLTGLQILQQLSNAA